MLRSAIWPAIILVPLLAAGCATVTTGTSQDIAIDTVPPGASCAFKRVGVPIGTIAATPGSVHVAKSHNSIAIKCEREGYEPAVGLMHSAKDDLVYGNALIGGIIGVMIDAQSGAWNSYPSKLTITLIPTRFASKQARDIFFDKMAESVRVRFASDSAEIKDTAKLKARAEQRDAELDQIEQRRARAVADSL